MSICLQSRHFVYNSTNCLQTCNLFIIHLLVDKVCHLFTKQAICLQNRQVVFKIGKMFTIQAICLQNRQVVYKIGKMFTIQAICLHLSLTNESFYFIFNHLFSPFVYKSAVCFLNTGQNQTKE